MADQELKACPFCGSAGTWQHGEYMYFVWCEKCDAHGGDRRTKDEAIDAWNTRAEPASVPTVQAMTDRQKAEHILQAQVATDTWFDGQADAPTQEESDVYFYNLLMGIAAPSQPVAGKTYNDGIREAIDAIEEIDDGNAPEFRACQEAINALFRNSTTANAGKDGHD